MGTFIRSSSASPLLPLLDIVWAATMSGAMAPRDMRARLPITSFPAPATPPAAPCASRIGSSIPRQLISRAKIRTPTLEPPDSTLVMDSTFLLVARAAVIVPVARPARMAA
jgi:hypothetical protein